MKALIVYCHPSPTSFNHAILETVIDELRTRGIDHRVIDLYREEFDPRLSPNDWDEYEDVDLNTRHIRAHVEAIRWCDTLLFVYPTWWFGQPAMLKGWLDRVLVPGVAFNMPTEETPRITHSMEHIDRLGVFTTCGATFWFTKFVGSPGKRTLLRGLRSCLGRNSKIVFAAHYHMDFSTDETRAKHLERVRGKVAKLVRTPLRLRLPIGGYNKARQAA